MVILDLEEPNEPGSLYYLWKDGSLADIQLKTSCGRLFKSHRLILAASSDFFRAMFLSSGTIMKEGNSAIIDLPNIDGYSLGICLEAIYRSNGASDLLTMDNVGHLISGASYLSIPKIRDECSEYMLKHLALENVVGTLILAEKYDCHTLKEEAHASTLQHLPYHLIHHILSSDSLEVMNEIDVASAAILWVFGDSDSRTQYLVPLFQCIRAPETEKDFNAALDAAITILTEEQQQSMNNTDASNNDDNGDDDNDNDVAAQATFHTKTVTMVENGIAHAIESLALLHSKNNGKNASGSNTFPLVESSSPPSPTCYIPTMPPRQGSPMQLMALGGMAEGWRGLKSTEVYNSRTDTWTPGPAMPYQCSFAAACTLGAHAYVIEGAAHLPAALRFDRRKKKWDHLPKLVQPRVNMAAAALPGSVYVLGGRAATGRAGVSLNSVEIFDITMPFTSHNSNNNNNNNNNSNSSLSHYYDDGLRTSTSNLHAIEKCCWRDIAPMNNARASLAACSLNNRVYALGGQSDRETHASIEWYDPGTDRWIQMNAAMQEPRKYLSAGSVSGQIIVVGGMTASRQKISLVEAIDPREGVWRVLPSVKVARSSSAVAVLNGSDLFVVGGSIGSREGYDGVECYSSTAGKWRTCASIGAGRTGLALTPI